MHDNPEEVRAAVRDQMMNPRLPYYQRMLVAAGYPEATEGVWSDAMIDGAVIWEARKSALLESPSCSR